MKLEINNSTLFLLDLDHTLIYGSFATSEPSQWLFSYAKYLTVYERPYARELVRTLQKKGDIIVFTSAKKDYAEQVCDKLAINPLILLSRKSCRSDGNGYRKFFKKEWRTNYKKVVIIDDSPRVWKRVDETVERIIPTAFHGEANDDGLRNVITQLVY
jgi:TFIIF-interacting CTD phosphatase-like protein